MFVLPVEEEAKERSQAPVPENTQRWMPNDPIRKRRLVSVLVKMVKHVLEQEGNSDYFQQMDSEELENVPRKKLDIPILEEEPQDAIGKTNPTKGNKSHKPNS